LRGLMVTNNKQLNVDKVAPKKKKYPDGKSLRQYGRYKTWSYKRWAWEFLCRNTKFRQACDRVAEASELSKSKEAKEFGLVKFKHYADVQTRENVFPVFKDGAIKTIPNISSEKLEKSVCIFPGQVLIRFKLKTEVDTIAAIEAQLGRARLQLYKLHAEYNQNGGIHAAEINEKIATDPLSLVQYLRILDLKANGIKSPNEIASFLYCAKLGTKQYENLDNLARTLRNSKKIEDADEYPIEYYRYLALRLGKPS